ncbi:polyprenyl synthetase family protein [Candidatus Saccharibacteria bacterium]|nr:polyprenyl synthetase family protein [Candidatus Saccharibacteria bacterium]
MPSLKLDELLGVPKLPDYLETVNQRLNHAVQSANPGLRRPLQKVISAKSKRLRPALLFASAGGKLNEKTVSCGTAIELLHLGSLVHDDLIDNADSRWGKLSIATTDGYATAVLAGDYLLASACAQAAKIDGQIAELISQTIINLIKGESLEAAEDYNLYRTEKSYFDCVQAKTAELISISCRLGGICAGQTQTQIKSLALYGNQLGISFQLIDDLLDILSSSKLLGKPVGNDPKNGVYTLPIIYSLRSGSQRQLKKVLKAQKISAKDLAAIVLADDSVQKTIARVNSYNQLARDSLDKLGTAHAAGLQDLPDAYLTWALNNLVLSEYQAKIV